MGISRRDNPSNKKTTTFKGIQIMKIKHLLITRFGHDDYSVWLTDDIEEKDSGYSERGSKAEIKKIVDEYMSANED